MTDREGVPGAAPAPNTNERANMNSDSYLEMNIPDLEVVRKAEEGGNPPPEESPSVSSASTKAGSGSEAIEKDKEGAVDASAASGVEGMDKIARVESAGNVLTKSKKTIIVLALCVCGPGWKHWKLEYEE